MLPTILSAHREKILPGDVIVLTVSDIEFSEEEILKCMGTFAEDADVYVLVFKESHYRDLKKISLVDLLALQNRIEQAIRDISVRDSRAEA